MEFKHKPVLLEETINGLNIKQNGIYVDGTLGGAGHSKEILKQLSSKGLDGCLFVFSQNEWLNFEAKLKALPLTDKNARNFVRFFLSGATECEIDKQGRFLIPSNLRVAAKLEKDAVIVGVGTRLEIWDKEIWQKCDENISADEIAENMTMLGI